MNKKNPRFKFRLSWVQCCWLLIALILLFGGIYSFVSHDEKLAVASRPLGIAMLFAGLINMIVCDLKSHDIHGSRWLIADGVTAVLLSLFPLFNNIILPVMIPFFFSMWELFSGILKALDSTELKEEKIKCWPAFAAIGVVELLSGTASLVKPLDDFVGMNRVIAIIFFVQSFGFFVKAVMYRYLVGK